MRQHGTVLFVLALALVATAGAVPWRDAHASAGVATAVTSGSSSYHTCAVTADHDLYCWGSNGYGQLGDGTTLGGGSPVEVGALHGTTAAVATGLAHTCALSTAGGVTCWGHNTSGQLGDGTTTQRLEPAGVAGLESGVISIGAGYAHSCAVLTGGSVRCWGNNLHGQLGNGSLNTIRTTPFEVPALGSSVAAIAAGDWYNCALMASGDVMCWGENTSGQLGNGSYGVNAQPSPGAVVGLGGAAIEVSAGAVHACAVLASGAMKCWGRNTYGQLGTGATGSIEPSAVAVSSVSNATGVGSGAAHTCAARSTGGVSCWGHNQHGQLGDGTTDDHASPAAAGVEGSLDVAAGSEYSCAVDGAGRVLCWGRNQAGQLGRATTVSPGPGPEPVLGLGPVAVGGATELPALPAGERGRAPVSGAIAFAIAVAASWLAALRFRKGTE